MCCLQEDTLAAQARLATLPPLQSVLELTTAVRRPVRSDVAVSAADLAGEAVPEAQGMEMRTPAQLAAGLKDGKGQLQDGTK